MTHFQNKVVIITNASSLLSRATAIQVASEGAKLCLVDNRDTNLDDVKQHMSAVAPHTDILYVHSNADDEEDVQQYIRKTMEAFGQIDGLFNYASLETTQSVIMQSSCYEYIQLTHTNLNSIMLSLKHVLPIMKQQGYGKIVNVVPIRSIHQTSTFTHQTGITRLIHTAAKDYTPYNVNINTITPGAILVAKTETPTKATSKMNKRLSPSIEPIKRFGKPEDVAYLAAFLLSDQANFIHATVIPIDGGASSTYTK